ncbi:MAG: helix-turn-helix domain-containing protein [Candidatus Omnitrophica bacterium]|nr:helix-turn-helix domain-containing protein [Candidatus Omnitrophota bacterium]
MDDMSDNAVLQDLGGRIARYRLNRNMTQEALAIEAGISRPTVQRVEQGESIQTTKFIRILRALNLLDHLPTLVPEAVASPLQQVKLRGKVRQRASSAQEHDQAQNWTWGEES